MRDAWRHMRSKEAGSVRVGSQPAHPAKKEDAEAAVETSHQKCAAQPVPSSTTERNFNKPQKLKPLT